MRDKENDRLERQLRQSQANLRQTETLKNYLVYLIKDICNYTVNPNRQTRERIEKNLKIFFYKVDREEESTKEAAWQNFPI